MYSKGALNATKNKSNQIQICKLLPVILKAFKPIDVQDSNLHLGIQILPNRSIDLINKPERNNKISKIYTAKKQILHK